jgi:membrane-bound metal-dependent hydrolase YbcI (DUF457 family)
LRIIFYVSTEAIASMILGHFAVALAAKRAAPTTSLGTTIFAALLLDLVWPILLLVGLERVRIEPGATAANPLVFEHYPYTHSLVAALLWALVAGTGYYLLRRRARGAAVVGVLVVSHWLLDAPMHAPDLPLWPGSDVLVGAGLWDSIPVTLALELGLLAMGLAVYLRATRPIGPAGRYGLLGMIALLLLIFLSGLFGSPPPSERALAVFALGLWLFVPWGFWVDRNRVQRGRPPEGPSVAKGARTSSAAGLSR